MYVINTSYTVEIDLSKHQIPSDKERLRDLNASLLNAKFRLQIIFLGIVLRRSWENAHCINEPIMVEMSVCNPCVK